MKDELGRKIMERFAGLIAKTYSYLIDEGSEDEKADMSLICGSADFSRLQSTLSSKVK